MPSLPRASLLCRTHSFAAFPFLELVPAGAVAAVPELPEPAEDPHVDMAREAAEEAAQAEIHRVRAEALEQGRLEGRDQGWAAGHAAGLEEGRAEGEAAEGARLRNAIAAVEAVLAEIREAERHWVDAAEENVSALAVGVARQILDRELRGSTAVFAELVRRALAEFPLDERVRIRLHPSDLAAISAMSGPTGESLSVTGGREAAWVADMDIGPGGCMIEGRSRIIDGRVDSGLERIYRRLTYNNA